MRLITRDTDYAVRALCYIACQGKRVVSVSEMVDELSIPKPFLRKILQRLHKKGILISYKGKGGGFVLSISASKINLSLLVETFQGKIRFRHCHTKQGVCSMKPRCELRKELECIAIDVVGRLRRITIQSLIREQESRRVDKPL